MLQAMDLDDFCKNIFGFWFVCSDTFQKEVVYKELDLQELEDSPDSTYLAPTFTDADSGPHLFLRPPTPPIFFLFRRPEGHVR